VTDHHSPADPQHKTCHATWHSWTADNWKTL